MRQKLSKKIQKWRTFLSLGSLEDMDSVAEDFAYMDHETKMIQKWIKELEKTSNKDRPISEIHDSAESIVEHADLAILTLVVLRNKIKKYLKRL